MTKLKHQLSLEATQDLDTDENRLIHTIEDLENKKNLYKQHQLAEEVKHSLSSTPIHPKKMVPLPVVINDSDTTV
jgi:hypothetical protein